MTIAIFDNKIMNRPAGQIKRLAGLELIKKLRIHWQNIHRDKYLLTSTYGNQLMNRGMPMRVWKRHSALLMLMNEYTDD